ncbi:hypothetical protein BKA64DRAFT_673085 [Cadophora sp. MPI-SDFR-AT-0126]|nr:hypothetical protein BKA64DRAFT_673085 [Leotiomycetes sp. MPI-SDFR-AT-0126]
MSIISSLSSVTNITRTSIHTDCATANLARICDDLDCLYPYGPACEACCIALDVKEEANQRRRPTETVAAWVEEIKVNRDITVYAGQDFTGGADAADHADTLAERQAAGEDDYDYVSVGDAVSELSEDDEGGCETDEEAEADFDDSRSDRTQFRTYVHSPTCTYPNDSSGLRPASVSSASDVLVPATLSPWLNTVFDNTLKGQLENTHFAGGANDEQDPDVDNCELCGRPLGDPTDQHYLKCKYAHEELERVAKWGAAWTPKRRM